MSDTDPASEAPGRFLRLPSVLARTGLSRSTLYRKLAAGTFPRQIQLSERCIGWSDTAVNAWLRDPARFGGDKSAV